MATPHLIVMLTAQNKDFFKNSSAAEVVVSTIYWGRDQGWYDLLAFVVLPGETRLFVAPRSMKPKDVVKSLKREAEPLLKALISPGGAIWAGKHIELAVRGSSDINKIVQDIHNAPVEARLSRTPAKYAFVSAHSRFSTDLDKYL